MVTNAGTDTGILARVSYFARLNFTCSLASSVPLCSRLGLVGGYTGIKFTAFTIFFLPSLRRIATVPLLEGRTPSVVQIVTLYTVSLYPRRHVVLRHGFPHALIHESRRTRDCRQHGPQFLRLGESAVAF